MARGERVPGKDPRHFAYVNTTVHRNLYRISLPLSGIRLSEALNDIVRMTKPGMPGCNDGLRAVSKRTL